MATKQEIVDFVNNHTDSEIAAAMNQYGVSPQEVAAATGASYNEVANRYEAAGGGRYGSVINGSNYEQLMNGSTDGMSEQRVLKGAAEVGASNRFTDQQKRDILGKYGFDSSQYLGNHTNEATHRNDYGRYDARQVTAPGIVRGLVGLGKLQNPDDWAMAYDASLRYGIGMDDIANAYGMDTRDAQAEMYRNVGKSSWTTGVNKGLLGGGMSGENGYRAPGASPNKDFEEYIYNSHIVQPDAVDLLQGNDFGTTASHMYSKGLTPATAARVNAHDQYAPVRSDPLSYRYGPSGEGSYLQTVNSSGEQVGSVYYSPKGAAYSGKLGYSNNKNVGDSATRAPSLANLSNEVNPFAQLQSGNLTVLAPEQKAQLSAFVTQHPLMTESQKAYLLMQMQRGNYSRSGSQSAGLIGSAAGGTTPPPGGTAPPPGGTAPPPGGTAPPPGGTAPPVMVYRR